MKKYISALLITLIILSAFSILSYAHPGRTDSNGGHWNHDTGEYHYHSGEYAGRSSNSSGSATPSDKIDNAEQEESAKKTYHQQNSNESFASESSSVSIESKKHNYDFGDILSIALTFVSLFVFTGSFIFTYIYPIFAVFFKDREFHKAKKSTNEPSAEKPKAKTEETSLNNSNYKSLIPEFIPPEDKKENVVTVSKSKTTCITLTVGEDITAGIHIIRATKYNGGIMCIYSSKSELLKRIYVEKIKVYNFNPDTIVKLYNCKIDD